MTWTPTSALAQAVYAAGFVYDPNQDIILSRMDPLQRNFGYAFGYDAAALGMSANLDCEPIFFDYDGKHWMIELWKGQYGLETGCEVGVYTRAIGSTGAVVRAGLPVRPRKVAYTPADFGLLVEIVSPSSTGMDRVLKPAEYAAAGVPFFWRVETEPVMELIGYELADGAYREVARAASGSVALPAPYRVVIDVDALSVP